MTDNEIKAIAGAALDVAKPRWRTLPANVKDELVAGVFAAIKPLLAEPEAADDEVGDEI